MKFQTVTTKNPDRTDHVWVKLNALEWKCGICGGIASKLPPNFPTPEDFMPVRYDRLTDEDRLLCPFVERGPR